MVVGRLHKTLIFGRRVGRLADLLCAALPGAAVLDVGCGDGLLDALIQQRRPDVRIEGIDVLMRPHTHIPVRFFDGCNIPFDDNSFGAVMFVDVLHHTQDPVALLQEAYRVSERWVLIKDHTADGFLARPMLRLMDWVGNRHHGVALPYNYWTKARWWHTFAALGLIIESWQDELNLYPWPASLVFDRALHFVARLVKPSWSGK
jgi:SAM-dependent methyltransferase